MEPIQNTKQQGRVSDAPSGHWVYRALPKSIWPYAQLARWDRPIGWHLLFWPCLWSATLVAQAQQTSPNRWHIVLFLIGAFVMRGAGCTYNDIVDIEIDAKVERTRSRPLPSGQITKRAAWMFLVLQALKGLFVLFQFNWFTIWLGFASLVLVAAYPFMKRVTNWPQLVLGLAFSWGALMGWAAAIGSLNLAPVLLYAAAVLWVVGYDTIYAHQDREDDALVGVGSTALLFGDKTKLALVALFSGMLVFMVCAFLAAQVHLFTYGGLVFAACHFGNQIRHLNIDDQDQCLRLFKSNDVIGLAIFLGLYFGSSANLL